MKSNTVVGDIYHAAGGSPDKRRGMSRLHRVFLRGTGGRARKEHTMTIEELKRLAQEIVSAARQLSAKHTDQGGAPVNYACIFTQSDAEFDEMLNLAGRLGNVVQETSMGPVFQIAPISTDAGDLSILKIRRPDFEY